MNEQLENYIKEQKEKGFSDDEIRKALLDVGWRNEDINNVFEAKTEMPSVAPVPHDNVSIKMQKLDPKAVWIFFFRYIPVSIALCYPIVFAAFSFNQVLRLNGSFGRTIGTSLIMIILVVVLDYLIAKLSYKFWQYQLTEDAYRAEMGIIFKKYVSIPYERIQNVDINRGILARILGLSDLQIQTAGYSGGYRRGFLGSAFHSEGRLPGLNTKEAEQLRDELIKRARGNRGGV
ncbi:PH domain-containing protein [Patescibacteria group bacterium]|nr:PH domain-containing protein [Patescibacteria group bacterium]